MECFLEIVRQVNLENDFLPLWKVVDRMTNVHVQRLVDFIDTRCCHHYNVSSYAQEVCLLYAYWWQKRANGGVHTYVEIIRDMNLAASEADMRNAVIYELTDARRLGIPVFRNIKNHYLDSVLAQGGIPLTWLANQENSNCLLPYLKALLHHYENVVCPDWLDTATAEKMAVQRGLSGFMQSEAFLEYCMSIVQSIIEKESLVSGSRVVQDIINKLVDTNKEHQYHLFGITWFVRLNPRGESNLCYSLDVPQKIDLDDFAGTDDVNADDENGNGNNISSRRYYLNGRFVAEYLRQGNHLILQQGSSVPRYAVLDDGVEALFMEKMDDNGTLEAVPISNSTIPVIEEPVSAQLVEGEYWKLNAGNKADQIGVIYPLDWCPALDISSSVVSVGGERYGWIEFNWNAVGLNKVDFNRGSETFSIDRVTISYELYLNFPQFDWFESASRLLVERAIDISRCVYVRDTDGTPIPNKRWKVSIKTADGYVPYNAAMTFGPGLNTLRITLPNGAGRYIRFFCVDTLRYMRINGSSFEFLCQGVDVNLVPGQEVTDDGNGVYVCREQILSVRYLLSANGTDMRLDVSAPKPDSSFWSIETGKKLPYNFAISINDLHKYKVYQNGNSKLNIALRSNLDNTTYLNAKLEWGRDQFVTLSFISGVLERMMVLLPLIRSRRIELSINNSLIRIVTDPYRLFTEKENGVLSLQVYYNEVLQRNVPLAAISVDRIYDDDVKIVDFAPCDDESGRYIVPAELTDSPFIVFSKDPSQRFPAELVDADEEDMVEDEHINLRNGLKVESINHAHTLLAEPAHSHWSHVWRLFDVIMTYHLPYVTFNSFLAIKNDPCLLAYFITHIYMVQNSGSDMEVVQELERMEYELGFAFHCVPAECFAAAVDDLRNAYNTVYAPQFANLNDDMKRQLSIATNEIEYLYLQCDRYIKLLERQFGTDDATLMFIMQLFNCYQFGERSLRRERDYAALISGTYIPCGGRPYFPRYNKPGNLKIRAYCHYRECNKMWEYMRYLCVIIPQDAARNQVTLRPRFWEYNEETNFTQRMINYIRRYAPIVYNEIFIGCLQ